MTLADLKLGQFTTIESIDHSDPQVLRLMELGLVEGTRLRFANAAIGGDPMELDLSGVAVSLRREQARRFGIATPASD